MNLKKITSLLTVICLIVSCFIGIVPVSAEDTALATIAAEEVKAAKLSPAADSTIAAVATQKDGYVEVAITSELLKKHFNEDTTPAKGYWAGFALVAPEGAEAVKYAFGKDDSEIEVLTEIALEADVFEGKPGIAFYVDASDENANTYAKVQWIGAEGAELSAETKFVMDLEGLTLDVPTPIPATEVKAAKLAADADSEIAAVATQKEGYVEVAITSELLKSHNNGLGTPGHWAGFALVAPEGATAVKYALDTNGESALTEIPLEVNVFEDKSGIAFYVDAASKGANTYAKAQWIKDGEPMSAETLFVMNLDGINLEGVTVDDTWVRDLNKKTSFVDLRGIGGDDVSVDFSKIKMEYFEGKEVTVKPTFGPANVADSDSNAETRKETVYKEGSYKVALVEDDYMDIINISMEDLVMHKNAGQVDGYWTGFKVTPPEGAKYLEYNKSFGGSRSGRIEFTESNTDVDFYIDVATCGYTEIRFLWLDENNEPLSPAQTYYIDIADVKFVADIEIKEANVCDSFPGSGAPAKVYETYSVETKEYSADHAEIIVKMTDLALHRNGNKTPGYWTGFTVKGPENAAKLRYNKGFGLSGSDTLELDATKETSFYFDVRDMQELEEDDRYVNILFLDDSDRPITREVYYEINIDEIGLKYPAANEITKTTVADYDGGIAEVYDADTYDVECDYDYIALSAKNLKSHTNGEGNEGHWIGFAVKAPEGATHYTYDFGDSYSDTPVALEEGEESVSFYVNASEQYPKSYLEIRWYSDETDPESYPYAHAYEYCSYYIDIMDVDLYDDKAVTVDIANIVDQANPTTAPYTGTPSLTEENGVLKLSVDGLKTHENGNGDLGAWVGVSFAKPEGAANVKYDFFGDNEWNSDYIPVTDGEISFYVDAFDSTPKDNIMIQWFDENDIAVTNCYYYTLDLSDVDYKVATEAALTVTKANIVDQNDPTVDPFEGEYDAKLAGGTIVLSADFLKDHENGETNLGSWIGFNAAVEGAAYVKYVFEDQRSDRDWSNATKIPASDAVFYVNATDRNNRYFKDEVTLQWFDENGRALTNVNTYKIDVKNVTLVEGFDILYSGIELTGADKRFYNLVSNNASSGLMDDEYIDSVSTADYVYILTDAQNGTATIKLEGEDESNGGNVFYRNAAREVTLVATPNSGYAFGGWYDRDGALVSGEASYKVKLNACYDLVAQFNRTSSTGGSVGGASLSVKKPTASVKAGEVEKGTKVELSTKTEGADIYYTLDGSTPTDKSTLYTDAIVINENVTIKAIAVKDGDKSGILTVKYTVKKAAEGEEDKDGEGTTGAAPVFADLSNHEWAAEAINALAEKGIIAGVSETEYAPANNIKRADYMLLLVRMLGLEAEVTENFADVAADKYYYEGVGVAKALELTSGVGNNNFNPEASITRQDMFVLAYRILLMQNAELEEADESAINTFDDFANIADYAKEALSVLVKNGLVSGYNNNINPTGNATRAETAVFIYGLYELLNK